MSSEAPFRHRRKTIAAEGGPLAMENHPARERDVLIELKGVALVP